MGFMTGTGFMTARRRLAEQQARGASQEAASRRRQTRQLQDFSVTTSSPAAAAAAAPPSLLRQKSQLHDSRRFFEVEALLESVESRAIAPLRGRWLVELWQSNVEWVKLTEKEGGYLRENGEHGKWEWHGRGGRLKRRQDLPPEAFFSAAELRRLVAKLGDDFGLLFVALSYRWLSMSHPEYASIYVCILSTRVHMCAS